MQVSLLPECMSSRPVTDVEKMQIEVTHIQKSLSAIDSGKDENSICDLLLESVKAINELIHLVDNANDFFKIGGFDLLPKLLGLSHAEVKAATAELIADLVQNNAFCQNKLLETNLAAELLNLLKGDEDVNVCIKALYALSCLCRSNHEAVVCLEKLDALPVLLQVIQKPVEKLRTKAAFLLSHLVTNEPPIRDTLYQVGFVQKLADLIKEEPDSSQEHLLCVLLTLVEHHNPSKDLCSKIVSLKPILEERIKYYEGKEEHQESKDYCLQLLKLCFDEGKSK